MWRVAALPLAASMAAACGYVPGLPAAVDIPPGVGHRMSVAQVEQTVLASVVKDSEALGRVIRPFRVRSIRLVAPFEPVRTTERDGQLSSLTFSTDTTTWVVHAEGTFRDCASTCSTYSAAVVVVDDGRGLIVGRDANGPMTLDPTDLRAPPGGRGIRVREGLERETGLEPATCSLEGCRSTN
jgi:hypothetical protein